MLNSLNKRLDALRQRDNQSGFTLIELLIVIVILGILAAVVVFSVSGLQNKGNASACQSDITSVQTAEEAYYAQNNSYAVDTTTLKNAGLIHSAPDDVKITVNAATATTAASVDVVGQKSPTGGLDCSGVTV